MTYWLFFEPLWVNSALGPFLWLLPLLLQIATWLTSSSPSSLFESYLLSEAYPVQDCEILILLFFYSLSYSIFPSSKTHARLLLSLHTPAPCPECAACALCSLHSTHSRLSSSYVCLCFPAHRMVKTLRAGTGFHNLTLVQCWGVCRMLSAVFS